MATTKIYIVYYSLHGHVEIMAREIHRGVNSVEGVEATLWQVPETLSSVILQKVKAPPKADDVPEIRPEQLVEADGFLFGSPSRFGVMASQLKAFFDATDEIWKKQALAGKPAGIFWSTGFHGGGQELTALTAVTQLAHHGMIFVPLGYTFGSGMFEMNAVKGGSAYGSGTFAADGSRQPTELELQQAFYQDLDLELHPDKGPNAPNALAEFQALQSSSEILEDEKDRKTFDDLVRVKRDQQCLLSQRNASYHLQHNASHHLQHNADDFEARQRAAMHSKKKAKVAATAFSVPKLDQEKVLIVSLNEDGEEYTKRKLRDFFSRIGKVEEVLFKNRGWAGIVMPTKDAAVTAREPVW